MTHSDTFDYIIVGAGSAGCVLANRLTASGRHRVLLLEAGGHDRRLWIHIPLGYGKLFTDRRYNWCYQTEPQPGSVTFVLRHKGYREEVVTVPANRSVDRKVPLTRSAGPDRAPSIHDP